MANSRIKDIATTAAAAASDDYLVIDGATNGTRKIAASDVGGGGSAEYDFTTALTPSIDSRGVSYSGFTITPANTADITAANAFNTRAYLINGPNVYPLIVVYIYMQTYVVNIYCKSINASTQGTTSTTVSGTLHIVSPYEVASVTTTM